MTHVRLSHPWRWHHVGDVLAVGVDLSAAQARHLIRAGYARSVFDLVRHTGGGWYSVEVSDGNTRKVRGYEEAVEVLIEEATE